MRRFFNWRVETKSLPVFGSTTPWSAASSADSLTAMGGRVEVAGGAASLAAGGVGTGPPPRIGPIFLHRETPLHAAPALRHDRSSIRQRAVPHRSHDGVHPG